MNRQELETLDWTEIVDVAVDEAKTLRTILDVLDIKLVAAMEAGQL